MWQHWTALFVCAVLGAILDTNISSSSSCAGNHFCVSRRRVRSVLLLVAMRTRLPPAGFLLSLHNSVTIVITEIVNIHGIFM